MRTYSEERKDSVLKKLLPPFNKSYSVLSKEEGIPASTICTWRTTRGKVGQMVSKKSNSATVFSAESRFAMIVETATMNESEISQYCREKGFYPEQIKEWKSEFIIKVGVASGLNEQEKYQAKKDKKRIVELEKDLRNKEKALAEAAALLILRKKLQAFYGEGDEED